MGKVHAQQGVGQVVLPLLSEAISNIDVASPYLSSQYAQMLVERARSGVAVRVLTSDYTGTYHRRSLHILASGRQQRANVTLWSIVVGLLLAVVLVSYHFWLAGLTVSGASFGWATYSSRHKRVVASIPNLQVKVAPSSHFVHAKLYIVDNKAAITGSANLTWTPMCEALSSAAGICQGWVNAHASSFPPTVVNITDGEATDGDPSALASNLRAISGEDGSVLLFNVHISSRTANPVEYPPNEEGLPDEYARLLFRMSSILPDPVRKFAEQEGYTVTEQSRGFAFNADMVSLIRFLAIGTRPVAALR